MEHTENAMRAAVKALNEVVAPALDPRDQQATLQLQLVVDTLEFVRERLDHVHERNRFDLRHHLVLARSLEPDARACTPATAELLREAIEVGEALHANADATTSAVRSAALGLAAALRTLVRDAADADPDARRRIERAVLDGTRERIDVDRSWHLPQGFDPEPGSVRPLEAVLATRDD